jgi:hypothetical protein
MPNVRHHLILATAVLGWGCATSATEHPTLLHPQAPLARSQTAALLEHASELTLTEEQVHKLEALEERRQHADHDVEIDLQQQIQAGAASHRGRATRGGGSVGRAGLGGIRGAAMNGPGAEPNKSSQPTDDDFVDGAQARIDENDTKAYADAEAALTDEQRAQAKPIIEQYRADVAKQREELQKRAASGQK